MSTMTRRSFLKLLPFIPAAVAAIAKAKPEAAPCPLVSWEVEFDAPGRHLIIENFSTDATLMETHWFQTTRQSRCTSLDYDDRLETIFHPRGSDAWRDAHKRIIHRRIARERAIKTPHLP